MVPCLSEEDEAWACQPHTSATQNCQCLHPCTNGMADGSKSHVIALLDFCKGAAGWSNGPNPPEVELVALHALRLYGCSCMTRTASKKPECMSSTGWNR